MKFRMLAAAAIVSTGLLLAGCVPSEPIVTPIETGAIEPIFASDDEALAAAVERYGDYLAAVDLVTAGGGTDPEGVRPFVTEEQFERHLASFSDWVESGERSIGATQFDSPELQQYVNRGAPEYLTFYVCLDVSNVRVLNAQGVDVTVANRVNRAALEIEVEVLGHQPSELRIARSEVWPDQQVCS